MSLDRASRPDFTTRTEVEAYVRECLGGYYSEHDIEAIARECFDYRVATDHEGNQLLNTAGFYQAVSESDFWEAVERHALETVSETR